MKFAVIDGIKRLPEPSKLGFCPFCSAEVIAKCGDVKIWHWAHKGRLECDPWWEHETEWHRSWKGHFPKDWQEVIHYADNGEKHIADVKTDRNWVIEFQHSHLKPDERKSRNEFYRKIIWVVNGKRLQGDEAKFARALNDGTNFGLARKVPVNECSLLRNWSNSYGPVFFDFGLSATNPEKSVLWVLLPQSSDGMAYIFPYSRTDFIEMHLQSNSSKAIEFEQLLNDWPALVENHNHRLSSDATARAYRTLPRYGYGDRRRSRRL